MRIILSGGGTIGSVSPLVAVFEEIKALKPETQFLWLSTRKGKEIKLISAYNIPLKKIFAGKFRRYFSFRNFIDPVFIFLGFCQSVFFILSFKPDVIVSAGGFVAVPLVWAAKIFRVKVLIHQQDVRPGLANLLMARFATKITVTFEKSIKDFFVKKTIWIGNPVRSDILAGDKNRAIQNFGLENNLPTLLVIGGGTGSEVINKLIVSALPELTKFCQVIHLTGGRMSDVPSASRYHPFEFLTEEMKDAYAMSDLVVSRAGMSVLTELSALAKPAVVIPIANNHQEDNASEFLKQNAIILAEESSLNPEGFIQSIKELISNPAQLKYLSQNINSVIPPGATQKMTEIILSMI
ncbi:MAG: UDP-N-acetylglucosamine--N-acetylmuramyl-(pentapeptide) pyrophosphoryl-undecaprenol N-acetylglucosamine transferase [Candidatus Buchananbacteria bacterium]|nr:UDP-N-acetylglucosamine--N-acetylmuramyl-(pentapeptide) pyrophosphoryl-undecaprenol N-acetylglucosamine transferase [Candidatus Buchananbacteria bacterium]